MPDKNLFEDLDWMESFALTVFIDLSLDADNGEATERSSNLLNEARKLLMELNLDPDDMLKQWKDEETEDADVSD